jgi:hypothetical protein
LFKQADEVCRIGFGSSLKFFLFTFSNFCRIDFGTLAWGKVSEDLNRAVKGKSTKSRQRKNFKVHERF